MRFFFRKRYYYYLAIRIYIIINYFTSSDNLDNTKLIHIKGKHKPKAKRIDSLTLLFNVLQNTCTSRVKAS
jgi:hypothetical protein